MEQAQGSAQKQVKILVVDDRRENLIAMDRLLKPLDAEIHKVDSGEKALSEVLNHRFAVILLDVQMPGMDGFETASLLHSNETTANIPIIFVTAINKEHQYVERGYESGAVDYLSKPIVPEILLSKVNVFLRLEKQRLELEQLSHELRQSSRKNKLLLENASEGIMGVDAAGLITFINPTACELFGTEESTLLHQHVSPLFFVDSENGNALIQWQQSDIAQHCLQQGETVKNITELLHADQTTFPAELSAAAITNYRNQVEGAVLVFQDITERKRLEDQLRHMAKHDNLTGLANRALFTEFLEAAMDRSERSGKQVGVMFLDLDHFKAINDELGHEAGDLVLIGVAKQLQSCVRKVDLVARLGGDEFAVILDGIHHQDDACKVATKILKTVTQPHDLNGESRSVGTSIGIAMYPDHGSDVDTLTKASDEAMYDAKQSGRNGYRCYSDIK